MAPTSAAEAGLALLVDRAGDNGETPESFPPGAPPAMAADLTAAAVAAAAAATGCSSACRSRTLRLAPSIPRRNARSPLCNCQQMSCSVEQLAWAATRP
jgi:hypothetical protein